LIVEFARDLEIHGEETVKAAIHAARLRLRPILMTSFAFIMGVVPLVISEGAGAEMRHAMGVAVFFGMLGVTFFGLLLTPVFYVVLRTLEKMVTQKTEPRDLAHRPPVDPMSMHDEAVLAPGQLITKPTAPPKPKTPAAVR
jgi:multidrug efflux pump